MHKQWFIITAIGGKEDAISRAISEKITNFNFKNYVDEIKVIKETIVVEEIFDKNDPKLPSTLKNTKTSKWVTLPNGKYKRIKSKTVNKFPGYIFINMHMTDDTWYAIRNTQGVLGFVGSTGKGSKPIPITDYDYDKMIGSIKHEEIPTIVEETKKDVVEKAPEQKQQTPIIEKKVVECNFKVGNNVIMKQTGEQVQVTAINLQKGTATVGIEMFGRVTESEVKIEDLELDNK